MLDKSLVHQVLPDFVIKRVDSGFFEKQKAFTEVEIIDYQSAFQSFNQYLDLRQQNIQPQYMTVLSYGYHPRYSTFYRNYPLGLTDDVDFSQLGLVEERIMRECGAERGYIDAVYSLGGDIIVL